MTDQLPLPGPIRMVCDCGCGTYGVVRRNKMRDGLHHVKGCPCRRCEGSRHKSRASTRERRIARLTGGERSALSGALSGHDGKAGLHVWEETSEHAIVRGFQRWIGGKGVEAKLVRLLGLSGVYRHFILTWDGKPRWVLTPYEDWAALVRTRNIPEQEK